MLSIDSEKANNCCRPAQRACECIGKGEDQSLHPPPPHSLSFPRPLALSIMPTERPRYARAAYFSSCRA